ncbi:uncharacterized protein N7529_007137 [Penicillium soppii]|uniref:uncharacterized protein n=1 Tax=Penicillium soppii TaxID=69789 RepID=UPI00254986E0|nr:uncharacterized protein N7529_007137 [Penicillium soppii]KAJ5865221.1 hypothetical protein N7529_007137 [Penicillium soppii]
MARTLGTKALQLHAILPESDESDVTGSLHNKIMDIWRRDSGCTLQESFESLELFDYASNFLLLKVFDTPMEHLDWVDNSQKSDIMDGHDIFLDNWMSFHQRLQSFLTPFDILSLFTDGIGKDNERKKVSLYLLKYLLSSDGYGFQPGMRELEKDVQRRKHGKLIEVINGGRLPEDEYSTMHLTSLTKSYNTSKVTGSGGKT